MAAVWVPAWPSALKWGLLVRHHGDWDALAVTGLWGMGCKEAPWPPGARCGCGNRLQLCLFAVLQLLWEKSWFIWWGLSPPLEPMATVSPHLKQRMLVRLPQLLACLAFPCPCPPQGVFLCLPACSPRARCRGCRGVRAMQQQNSPLPISATARKAFPSSRITAGYPAPNTGCGHISRREGARTPPLFVPHQTKMPALPCCLDRAPTPTRQWGPWAVGTPGSPFGSTWVPMSYLGVSHLLPQPLLPGMLRMQKLTAAQTSFYPYIVSAYTLPS